MHVCVCVCVSCDCVSAYTCEWVVGAACVSMHTCACLCSGVSALDLNYQTDTMDSLCPDYVAHGS